MSASATPAATPPKRIVRKHGACATCIRIKRRCDQARPTCGECKKRGLVCESKNFKNWSGVTKNTGRNAGASEVTRRVAPNETVIFETTNLPTPPPAPEEASEIQKTSFLPDQFGFSQGFLNEPVLDMSLASAINPWQPPANVPVVLGEKQGSMNTFSSSSDPLKVSGNENEVQNSSDSLILLGNGSHVENNEHALDEYRNWLLTSTPVPRPLRPLQMPEELTNSSDKGFLWSYYIQSVARNLVPFDITQAYVSVEHENPFLVHVPRLAFHHPHLMKATLAFSRIRYNRAQRRIMSNTSQRRILEDTQDDLNAWLGSHESSDDSIPSAMATTLMLCLCKLAMGETRQWHDHLRSVRSLATSLTSAQSLLGDQDKSLYRFLMNFIGYAEIVSNLSLGSIEGCSRTLADVLLQINRSEPQPEAYGFSTRSHCIVHPVLAFSRRLVEPLYKLGNIIQKRKEVLVGTHDDEELTIKLSTMQPEIDEVEDMLLTAEDTDRNDIMKGTDDLSDSLADNDAFHAAGFLLFYARLRDLPSTAMLIRRRVRDVIEASHKCVFRAQSIPAMILPLFTAGCEAVDRSDRQELLDTFTEMEIMCLTDAHRLKVILNQIWIVRDQDPGLAWWEWQTKVEEQLGRCIVF